MEIIAYMLLGIAAWTALKAIYRHVTTPVGGLCEPDPLSPAQIMATDLSMGVVRERLTKMLAGLGITGDANIRNGYVVETVPPRDLGDVNAGLRVRVSNLLGHASRGRMQGRDLYYAWKATTPLPGAPEIEYRLADIELDDIAKLVVLSERVAEDRKRSRSLYKGLDDGEITALVRTAMRSFYDAQADGQFFDENASKADAARRGELDNTEAAAVARAAILQLFEIKGATA